MMSGGRPGRMVGIVEPAKLDPRLWIFVGWESSASGIGVVTGTGRFRGLDRRGGEVLADTPASALDDDAPLYDRPMAPPADLAERQAAPVDLAAPSDAGADLLDLLAATSWVWSQYDHHLLLNPVEGPEIGRESCRESVCQSV